MHVLALQLQFNSPLFTTTRVRRYQKEFAQSFVMIQCLVNFRYLLLLGPTVFPQPVSNFAFVYLLVLHFVIHIFFHSRSHVFIKHVYTIWAYFAVAL